MSAGVPDYETLMLPLLQAVGEGVRNVAEAQPVIKRRFGISDAAADELIPSGRVTVLASRLHWARSYMSKAGLLTSPRRNVHELTDRGRAVLARGLDRIDNSVLAEFPEFVAWKQASAENRSKGGSGAEPAASPSGTATPSVPEALATPDEQLQLAYAEIEADLSDRLLREVLLLSPRRFERLIIDLLRKMGYGGGSEEMYRETPGSGDNGFDGVIDEDALGLDAVYIQAKRYAPENKVGRPALQAFVGSLTGEGATKGVSSPPRDSAARPSSMCGWCSRESS